MKQQYQAHQYPLIHFILLVIFFFCFVINAAAQNYCLPGNSDCSQMDEILTVKFGTLNNNSICVTNGYSDFTTLAAPVFAPGATAIIFCPLASTRIDAVPVGAESI